MREDDEDYRINALFLFNCGTHGDFEDSKSQKLYESRYALNKRAADELGLPVYQVNSNLHAFTHKIGEQRVGYFAIWSCVLALGKAMRMYYISSASEYEEIKKFECHMKDFDMAGFCESYLVPLVRTEGTELVIDGCQYRRTQKTANIADWNIAQKYLNVCVNSEDGTNCSVCSKCMRTLISLDAMGKLDDFAGVFNLDVYRHHAFFHKLYFKSNTKKLGFAEDISNLCIKQGYAMPPAPLAHIGYFLARCVRKIKNTVKKR